MLRYSARRVVESIPTLLGIAVLTFLLVHAVPGGPAQELLGNQATPLRIAEVNREFGLDKPLPVQFAIWFWQLLHGNLGVSYQYNLPVSQLIMQALPRTLSIVGISTVLAMLVAIIQGLYQAKARGSVPDHAITGVTYFLYSMPTFWLAVILIMWFAIDIPVFPGGGLSDPGQTLTFGVWVDHITLPVICLTLVSVAGWGRYMRSSTIDSLVQDYIRTARAKGVRERVVLTKHAFRNSLLPLITLFGLSIPIIFTGALFIEEIFNIPGLGYLFWNAALNRDYPIIMGSTVIIGVLTVIGNLVADLLYGVVDPRISYD